MKGYYPEETEILDIKEEHWEISLNICKEYQ